MEKKKMLLFGGTGMVGTRIRELLSDAYIITSPTRQEVDLTSKISIFNYFSNNLSDVVVYAAGITNQDIAEKEKELAKEINTNAIEYICLLARPRELPVVYFSTDAVFPCEKSNKPYTEFQKTNPLNYYGITKANGENAVLSICDNNLVIRLVSVYSSTFLAKLDFVRRIINKLSHNNSCDGIMDQHFNPTFSDVAVYALGRALEREISGILHIGATDCISNYDFAKLVASTFGYDIKLINAVNFEDLTKGKKVKRGKFCCIDTAYSQSKLGKEIFLSNFESIAKFKDGYLK